MKDIFDYSPEELLEFTVNHGKGSWKPNLNTRWDGGVYRIKGGLAPLNIWTLNRFLRGFIKEGPGEHRIIEMYNIDHLGKIFRKHGLLETYYSSSKATAAYIGGKRWCLEYLRLFILEYLGPYPFSGIPDWEVFDNILPVYFSIMEDQAETINKYRATKDESYQEKAWSYGGKEAVFANLKEILKLQNQ